VLCKLLSIRLYIDRCPGTKSLLIITCQAKLYIFLRTLLPCFQLVQSYIMSNTRPVYLALFRNNKIQRAHFAIFIPNAGFVLQDPNNRSLGECKGTLIHVIGAPMAGYRHEFRRAYDIGQSKELERTVRIGETGEGYIKDFDVYIKDDQPTGVLERQARLIRPPPIS
jgi:hypothetical protein